MDQLLTTPDGVWSPTTSLAYGIARASFVPLNRNEPNANGTTEDRGELNPHQVSAESVNGGQELGREGSMLLARKSGGLGRSQRGADLQVPLEVGDEVYVVEVFRPSSPRLFGSVDAQVWYRGYVVSTTPRPRLPLTPDLYSFPSSISGPVLPEEPEVSLGIFPASHVQIREHLEDAERKLSDLAAQAEAREREARKAAARLPSKSMNGRMEPLQEEDEEEENDFEASRQNGPVSLVSNGSPTKARNRTSVGSIASFASQLSTDQQLALQSSRVSHYGGSEPADTRPAPPLPNLKCGDETASGADEPLIDEIACALREWASLLYTHLYHRDYALFESVRNHFEVLHAGRNQLLARTLSQEESSKLRKEAVARLAQGNIEQGLDIIVRHPVWGGLVDVNVEGEIERKGWLSISHSSDLHTLAQSTRSTYLFSTDHHEPSPPFISGVSSSPSTKFYHVFVDVRSLAASICAPGELVELYLSLFNKTDARYVTEEFCLVLNHNGVPIRDSNAKDGRMRTLFRDLSQHDVQDQLYLVCRFVKNGAIKTSSGSSVPAPTSTPPMGSRSTFSSSTPTGRSETASMDSASVASHTGTDHEGSSREGMLWTDGAGRPSYRRPFGCAVLEISQFNKPAGSAESLEEHQMPIFVPVNESAISTLHEDIIGSRIKEIEKSPRADYLSVAVRILHGEVPELVRDLPNLLADVPLTNRLGFPDVVFPGDQRNEVYIKLWSGDFGGAASATSTTRSLAQLAASSARNIEVTAELRTRDGTTVERVLSRGAGEPNVSRFTSMVFRSNNNPTWGELVKVEVPVERMEDCHLFFVFRARGSRMGTVSSRGLEPPFAFAYFPLFLENSAFQNDGSHTLVLYRYDRPVAVPSFYFQVPSTHDPVQPLAPLPPSVSRTLFPLRDTMVIRSFLVSTTYTQNETLLKLLRWEKELLPDPELMKDTLTKLRFCSEVEVCKFLRFAFFAPFQTPAAAPANLSLGRDIFDALFGILVSAPNQRGEMDDLVFQALVTILGFVSDRRFTNFKPVLDVYIAKHFTGSTAGSHIIQSLQRLLRTPGSAETGTTLRSSIKVWRWLFKFIVRSREIQRTKDVGLGVTSDHLESSFKNDLSSLLSSLNGLMRATTPSSIIGTQTLAVQNFASVLPSLAHAFDHEELAEMVTSFVDAIGTPKGKMIIWRLLLLNQLATSVIFASPTGRAALVPNFVRWLKPSLGKFDEHAHCKPKDPQSTRDNARVSWIEGIRLSVGVVAVMLDTVQEALIDPIIVKSRSLLGQEQDNLEYLLGLLPRLLDSYRELENLANLDAVERQRSQASVASLSPVVFPSSYPISLLSYSAEYARRQSVGGAGTPPSNDKESWPTLRAGVGEVACVFIALILLAPRKIFVNWLESTLEIEGKDTFARQLAQMFRVSRSILKNEAFPADWLNITVLAHRVVIKLVEPISDILIRDFVPPASASFTFNTGLWRDFFNMLLALLASPQLLIEEFSPQKRRAVWRLAGDIRGEGANTLIRLWNAIAWPQERKPTRFGLYQVQFVPGLVEDILSLCLSHHDELRRNAVQVLYSMIVSEVRGFPRTELVKSLTRTSSQYHLNGHFAIIEAEVIDRLDKLFGVQTKGDEISRAFFVTQLRQLFDESEMDDELRQQVDTFLDSINSFLDLLLAVRNLPEGEEYQEDRIISTLKLMSVSLAPSLDPAFARTYRLAQQFIRGIGRSEIFIRYVQRLVTYHVALASHTEAGLTLKLHADLHQWDLSTFVDALPDLDLPRQTEFARKETLYMRVLEHLNMGKAWETALAICKELQHEYETKSFNYTRLAELLNLEAELYASIAKSERHFGNYFRVAFYGSRWPMSVSGKQFVYRGAGLETLGAFIEKMLNKHPGYAFLRAPSLTELIDLHRSAQLLKTSSIPTEDVQYGEGQFLQITAVTAEVDQTSPFFTNPDVPDYVRRYYEHNDVNTFSFTRALTKDAEGHARPRNDFTSLWTEKTVLICEESFPTVLRRSEIIEIRLIEISPLENALQDVDRKRAELSNLERRYRALSLTEPDARKINSNPLSMALNGAVDAPLNQGIPHYRHAFLAPEFIATLPHSQLSIIRPLEQSIDELVITLASCLKLHASLCPPEMQPFHETLERCTPSPPSSSHAAALATDHSRGGGFFYAAVFEKNFSEELARLPSSHYEPATFPSTSLSPSASASDDASLSASVPPRAHSSLMISSVPTIRRDSTFTHDEGGGGGRAGSISGMSISTVNGGGAVNGGGGRRTPSVYSYSAAATTSATGGRSSPSSSMVSSSTSRGVANGSRTPSSASHPGGGGGGGGGSGPGRRASLFAVAASSLKGLGKRKTSMVSVGALPEE
ncbi:SPOSA6832_04218 [Sporobolomyces salmonicolor]|uniref:SPOSA6832_04218-mRNA-1:cds n=1 Tax=Sporidiobolus salmonicolor TaxID=5005 RepID=A0A0D6ES51_SPOSA|nr:SPOSA6832_04218 [Sporobolomyces salmonicolor]